MNNCVVKIKSIVEIDGIETESYEWVCGMRKDDGSFTGGNENGNVDLTREEFIDSVMEMIHLW